MTLDEYLKSAQFQAFLDEDLRNSAIQAATNISQDQPHLVTKHQLYCVSSIIFGSGLSELRKLAKHQKEKEKKKYPETWEKAFWSKVDELLSATSKSKHSIFNSLKELLLKEGFIESENISDQTAQKQIRKRNGSIIEGIMDQILIVYFEHFNCHYFTIAQQGGPR